MDGADVHKTPFNISSVRYTELPSVSDEDGRRKVLIVDDDMDVIHYLKELLAPRYEVMSRFENRLKTCSLRYTLVI